MEESKDIQPPIGKWSTDAPLAILLWVPWLIAVYLMLT